MKFPGVDDMNAALALKGKDLYIRRSDAKLPEGACFDAELLGMAVYDAATGEALGKIIQVDPYPAHKVYTVRGAREYLIGGAGGVHQVRGSGRRPDGGPRLGGDGRR